MMSTFSRAVVVVALVAVTVGIGAINHQTSRYATAFADSKDGETEVEVVGRFGQPSNREVNGQPFLRYAIRGCEAPCSKRLWWEHPVLRGIEAWSVEFDSQGRSIHKAHWVSP
jgi:hypothetical protein